MLESEVKLVENRARKYYKLTAKGKKAATKKINELKDYIQIMNFIVNPSIA